MESLREIPPKIGRIFPDRKCLSMMIGERMKSRLVLGLFFTALLSTAALTVAGSHDLEFQENRPRPWLTKDLERGEAVVWYSFHSGWAVKTRNHLLVFDYVGPRSTSGEPSLETGHILPAEIAAQNVTVFVSHAHGDHYVPEVETWRKAVPGIRYVWGWPGVGAAEDIHFGEERISVTLDGLEVLNIHHAIDGIPESAFLVRTDGLSIIFAGDHAHRNGIANPVFKSNLEYLAEQAPGLDLYFTPTFGGEMDAVRILKPRAVFPMHDGGNEGQYATFAARLEKAGFGGAVGVASRSGDRFFYAGGRLRTLLD
jgi:L-ascorbate metabolism protein UlaG (beta-lactamase superfamily)